MEGDSVFLILTSKAICPVAPKIETMESCQGKKTWPLTQRDTLYVSSWAVCYILEKIFLNKYHASLLRHAEAKETHGELSPDLKCRQLKMNEYHPFKDHHFIHYISPNFVENFCIDVSGGYKLLVLGSVFVFEVRVKLDSKWIRKYSHFFSFFWVLIALVAFYPWLVGVFPSEIIWNLSCVCWFVWKRFW